MYCRKLPNGISLHKTARLSNPVITYNKVWNTSYKKLCCKDRFYWTTEFIGSSRLFWVMNLKNLFVLFCFSLLDLQLVLENLELEFIIIILTVNKMQPFCILFMEFAGVIFIKQMILNASDRRLSQGFDQLQLRELLKCCAKSMYIYCSCTFHRFSH